MGINYFKLGFLSFLGLGLELVLKIIEEIIYKGPMNYIIHWILTCMIWGVWALWLVKYAKRSINFDVFNYKNKPKPIYIAISLGILISVIILGNVLFWKGFKPFIEFKSLGFTKFIFQYIYYLFEIFLVTLIIIFGQKGGDLLFKKPLMPWGGLFLGLTWGIFHVLTKDFFTGLVLFFISILFGIVYILLGRNIYYAYPFILLMFIL